MYNVYISDCTIGEKSRQALTDVLHYQMETKCDHTRPFTANGFYTGIVYIHFRKISLPSYSSSASGKYIKLFKDYQCLRIIMGNQHTQINLGPQVYFYCTKNCIFGTINLTVVFLYAKGLNAHLQYLLKIFCAKLPNKVFYVVVLGQVVSNNELQ